MNSQAIRTHRMVNEVYNGDYIIKENDSFKDENPWKFLPLENKLKIHVFKGKGLETELFDVYTKNKRHYQADKIRLRFSIPETKVLQYFPSLQIEQLTVSTKHELIKTLLSFKALVNNWDGHGAIPLELESATNAITIISLADNFLVSKIYDVYPNPNGTVSILWKNQNDEAVSLEIGNNSMSYYVSHLDKDSEFFDNVQIDSSSVEKLSSFVRLL